MPDDSFRIDNGSLEWLEADLPFSSQFEDIYYSRDDELGESRHVFLDGNKLQQRWLNQSRDCFRIGELGFGGGLNFLSSWQLWGSTAPRPAYLHYVAFEKYPLRHTDIARLHRRWPELASLSAEFLSQYPDHSSGCHRLQFDDVILDLHYGDGEQRLGELIAASKFEVDAWYLDGFSPKHNPDLWGASLFGLIADTSSNQASLATYSVAGSVRNELTAAGWKVYKRPGFGRKRQMLVATLDSQNDPPAGSESDPTQTWFRYPRHAVADRHATVIGAGLAGCSMAYSLARRGWRVSLLEQQDRIAAGAAGIWQLALRPRLFQSKTAASSYYLHGFLHSARQFTQLAAQHQLDWHPCGVIQLDRAMNKKRQLSTCKLQRLYEEAVVTPADRESLNRLADIGLSDSGLYFPLGGWIDPVALCGAYLAHPSIDLQLSSPARELAAEQDCWTVSGITGKALSRSPVVIVTNSAAAGAFEQCSQFPLEPVRGQASRIASNPNSASLQAVISGERTLFPAWQDRHTLSASYAAGDTDLAPRPQDHVANIENAAACFSNEQLLENTVVDGRCAIRCNTPDRLPIVGMLPDLAAMAERYAGLSRNARGTSQLGGDYHVGLYASIGHGSNGLAGCPLASEYLASVIEGESLPLDQDVMQALHPARFLIRDLKKQRLG